MPDPATQPGTKGLVCKTCGYALQGLPEDSVCPECALPIIASRGNAGFSFSPPAYIERVRSGLILVQRASLASAIAMLLNALYTAAASPDSTGRVIRMTGLLLFAAAVAAIYLGWWRAARPDPAKLFEKDADKARDGVRFWSLGGLVCCGLVAIAAFGVEPGTLNFSRNSKVFGSASSIVFSFLTIGSCIAWFAPLGHFISTIRFASRFNVRAGSTEIARLSVRARTGLLVFVGLFLLSAIAASIFPGVAEVGLVGWVLLAAWLGALIAYALLARAMLAALAGIRGKPPPDTLQPVH